MSSRGLRMRWGHVSVCVVVAVVAGCGGRGGDSPRDAGGTRALTPEESEYADKVASANEDLGSAAETRCVGQGIVRVFGLSRAKELELEDDNTPFLSRSDAENAIGVVDGCTSLAELLLAEGKDSLGLSDAEVVRCAQLLDRAKVREFFVKSRVEDGANADETRELQDDLIAALPRCKD